MAEYYRLNFQRKPEHMGFPTNNLFAGSEIGQRVMLWQYLSARVDGVGKNLPPEAHDAFFELVEYPVKAARLQNEKILVPAKAQLDQNEIERLTGVYNNQIAGGKWNLMMSSNPRKQLNFVAPKLPAETNLNTGQTIDSGNPSDETDAKASGADFVENNHQVIMEAAHASAFVPGEDAHWQKITGLGYNGEAVSVFPTTVAVRATPHKILAESPCLQFKVSIQTPGDWRVTVRALPTFSVETGKQQRYAIAFDDAPPQIISLPLSQDEKNKTWQENVLRNAAPTTSTHMLAAPGAHTLKIWMVDPGIVLDTIAAQSADAPELGYVWPLETRVQK
jgi:hypothetical protein